MTMVRLACYLCDTEEDQTLTLRNAKRRGWTDLFRQQTYKQSFSDPFDGEPDGVIPVTMDEQAGPEEWAVWWTHIGYCPECNGERVLF